jgi:hypothetical protein
MPPHQRTTVTAVETPATAPFPLPGESRRRRAVDG